MSNYNIINHQDCEMASHLMTCVISFQRLIYQCDMNSITPSPSKSSNSSISSSSSSLSPSERSQHIQNSLKSIYTASILCLQAISSNSEMKCSPSLVELIVTTSSMIKSTMPSDSLYIASNNMTPRKVLLSMSLYWCVGVIITLTINNPSDPILKSLFQSLELLLSVNEVISANQSISSLYSMNTFFHMYPNVVFYSLSMVYATNSSGSVDRIECFRRLILLRVISQCLVAMPNTLHMVNSFGLSTMQIITMVPDILPQDNTTTNNNNTEAAIHSMVMAGVSDNGMSQQPTLRAQVLQLMTTFMNDRKNRTFYKSRANITATTTTATTTTSTSATTTIAATTTTGGGGVKNTGHGSRKRTVNVSTTSNNSNNNNNNPTTVSIQSLKAKSILSYATRESSGMENNNHDRRRLHREGDSSGDSSISSHSTDDCISISSMESIESYLAETSSDSYDHNNIGNNIDNCSNNGSTKRLRKNNSSVDYISTSNEPIDHQKESLDLLSYAATIMTLLNQAPA